MYEFLVGLPPFNADSVEEIFENIKSLRMEWPEIGRKYGISMEFLPLFCFFQVIEKII